MIIDIASLLTIFLEHDNLPFKIELPDIEKKKAMRFLFFC